MYDRIGKATVKFAFRYVRRRYRREARIALALIVLAVGIAAYLASREVPEG
jgi:hypothetical protein